MYQKGLVTLALGIALLAPEAMAQSRPPALGYAGQFWPNYSIWGRRVSKKTRFGTLICEGTGYKGRKQRTCYWK